MKSRPESDPTSWQFQANIHGSFAVPADPLWNQCEHGTIQFLTWHRAYLYFFERILRAASCDPCLTLPYWNWYSSPSLPPAYRQPADASNPLYDGTRNPAINAGGELPHDVVVTDTDDALDEIDFWPWPGFSDQLEGSPHGAVHVLIGGNMGFVPLAANDPIFWLHHGNIDRLWDLWLSRNAGRSNPIDPAFLDQQYSFANECGQTVTIKVRDYISSGCLGYRYDDVCLPAAAVLAAGQPQPQSRAAAAQSGTIVASSLGKVATRDVPQDAKSIPLALSAHTSPLTMVQEGGEQWKRVEEGSARLAVDIQGISFSEMPQFTYGVYLNLADGEVDEAKLRAHYVGAINFFGRGHHGKHADMPTTFTETLDATKAAARLGKAGQWDPAKITVTLRPLTVSAPAGQEDQQRSLAAASAEKAKVAYKRIVLRTVPR